ncbi:MAG: hypothetical protein AAGF35_07755, partial [Pseudomonadota bacterium]
SAVDRGFRAGIMQLALLARCGNIASSVIATGAQKNTAPPKIHITDENERTVSYHSEAAATPVEPGKGWLQLLTQYPYLRSRFGDSDSILFQQRYKYD